MTGCSFGDVPMDSPNNPIDAVIFDTDGVVTRTASVHFAAWKRVFDTFLSSHARGDAAAEFTDDDATLDPESIKEGESLKYQGEYDESGEFIRDEPGAAAAREAARAEGAEAGDAAAKVEPAEPTESKESE